MKKKEFEEMKNIWLWEPPEEYKIRKVFHRSTLILQENENDIERFQ